MSLLSGIPTLYRTGVLVNWSVTVSRRPLDGSNYASRLGHCCGFPQTARRYTAASKRLLHSQMAVTTWERKVSAGFLEKCRATNALSKKSAEWKHGLDVALTTPTTFKWTQR